MNCSTAYNFNVIVITVNTIIKYRITHYMVCACLIHSIRALFIVQWVLCVLLFVFIYISFHRSLFFVLKCGTILYAMANIEFDHWSMCSIPSLLWYRLNAARLKYVCGSTIYLTYSDIPCGVLYSEHNAYTLTLGVLCTV